MTEIACAECGCRVDAGVRTATCGDADCCCRDLPVLKTCPSEAKVGAGIIALPSKTSAAGVSRALDRTFKVGMVLKGADGVLEVIGGMLLLFLAPATIEHVVRSLVAHELSQDHHDFIATQLLHSATHLTRSSSLFGAVYLLSHGAAKVVLVALVLRDRLWAYPWMIALLVAFVIYQLYRVAIVKFSIGLVALTIFDLVLVWLTWREYQAKQRLHHAG